MSQSSWRADVNAILLPSGDQAGLPSSKSPSVSWLGGSEPSAGTTNRWRLRSPVQPSLSNLNCRRENLRGRRRFSSSSSYSASRTRAENASRCPSGRPGDLADVLVELGQPRRLAACNRNHVELLRLDLLVAVGDEREPRAVGRPARRQILLRPGRQPPRRFRAVDRHEPDRRGVVVLLLVEPDRDECDRAPVGRDARVVGPGEAVEIVGLHAPRTKAESDRQVVHRNTNCLS